ncbi:unnamed protein product [Closterium sp. NIES-53]
MSVCQVGLASVGSTLHHPHAFDFLIHWTSEFPLVFRRTSKPATMGLADVLYRTVMKRNSVYIGFIFVGALAGERAVNYTFDQLWDSYNKGKRYEDISVLGTRTGEE